MIPDLPASSDNNDAHRPSVCSDRTLLIPDDGGTAGNLTVAAETATVPPRLFSAMSIRMSPALS